LISWLEGLAIGWLIFSVCAGTLVVTAGIYFAVTRLASGDREAAFGAVSPGLLSPMGLVFGLIVGFLVAGLWSDIGDARDAVNHEASALRAANLIVAASFPGEPTRRIDILIRQHIQNAATTEWPAMADQKATLTLVPRSLAQALQVALALKPKGAGEVAAQRELVSQLENAFAARRERIIVSRSDINWVKWLGVIGLAALTLIAVAFVHSGNRLTAAIAMGVFGAAVAVTLVLIASQARPFSGPFGVKPDVLLQVKPGA
jgi:hypothetical protein